MAFNIEVWKEENRKGLQGWQARFNKANTNSAYYFLAAVSFVPVVQAFYSGDFSALSVLGMSLGGAVGTNLLANMVQNLKDKSEDEIALALADEMQATPELKSALDALLENLETLPEAGRQLPDKDKAWFVETIQQELKGLHSGIKVEVAERGVYIGGKAENNIIVTGNNNRVVKTETYIEKQIVNQTPDPNQIKAAETAEARESYLKSVYRRCQSLPLAALGDDPNARDGVKLDDVYIDLHTTEKLEKSEKKEDDGSPRIPGRDDEEPLPAFDAFLKTPQMVLLGDPGSGKSTFVRNLLAMQAEVLCGEREALNGVDADLLPVLVTLRDLIARLSKLDCKKGSAERRDAQLVQVVDEQITSDLSQLYRSPEFEEGLKDALANGQVLLAFDGLDEVPEHLREKVRLAVAAYQKAYELPRVIVTSRIRSYLGSAVQPGFTAFTLAPFTQEQVRKFCQGWYDTQVRLGKVDVEIANEQAQDLARAAWRDELQKLAENPMLLTTMAIIHQKETRLPDQRVKLYSEAVRILIERWQKHRFGDALAVNEELANVLKDERRVRKILERLAYEAHRVGKKNAKDKEADLLRKDALNILEANAYLGDLSLASQFLDYVDLRSGLLVGRGGEPGKPSTYSFAHRTFQEYLAGCYLVNQRNAVRDLLALAEEPEYWSLAVEFGSEEILFNGRTESQNDVLDLAYGLLAEKRKTTSSRRAALWSAKMASLVGAEIVREDELKDGASYLDRLLKTTLWLLESDLTPVERADAGRALAKLGDPRLSVMDVDVLEFSLILAGKFWLGEKDELHQLTLPTFWMSRYPVTNAQYMAFVDGGGYRDKRFWGEAEKADVWKDGTVKGRWDDKAREAPANYDEPFGFCNHPVVGISWYEMLAFTRWLDLRWRKLGLLSEDWRVALPSETEWEKAARGGIQIPKVPKLKLANKGHWEMQIEGKEFMQNPIPQRAYPWGDEFDLNKTNNSDTGIGTTCTVGCFAEGVSPYGVHDLSGNVWEWGRSLYEKYPYPESGKDLAERENLAAGDSTSRVLRGGAFLSSSSNVRGAYRNRDLPFNWNINRGFRVVVVPSSSS
jgi:formylglycine-generating enzyme required for sulfatase activity